MINDLKKSEQINDTSFEILSNISIDIKNNYEKANIPKRDY